MLFNEREMSLALAKLFELFSPSDYEAFDEEEIGYAGGLCLPEVCMALKDAVQTVYQYSVIGRYRDLREGLISNEDYAQTREVILGEIKRLEKQLEELEGTTNRFEEQLRGEKKWAELVKKYHNATEVTAEMVDAMIVSMKMNEDSSLSIEFNHMDEFKAIYDTIDILRKEVA